MQILPLTAHLQADEVTQHIQRDLPLELQFEGKRATSVSTRLLTHFHHQISRLRFGEDQFTAN